APVAAAANSVITVTMSGAVNQSDSIGFTLQLGGTSDLTGSYVPKPAKSVTEAAAGLATAIQTAMSANPAYAGITAASPAPAGGANPTITLTYPTTKALTATISLGQSEVLPAK